MKIFTILPFCLIAPALLAASVQAQTTPAADEAGAKATVIYRQVTPSGGVVYSDKATAGAKLDHTITVTPPIKGNLWTTEPPEQRPAMAPQSRPTPIQHVASLPPVGKKIVSETAKQAAALDVMRAEMLLEDARKRQAAGVAPQPAELRDSGANGSPYNRAYFSRQKILAQDVAYAEQQLKKAQDARDQLREQR